MEKSYRTNNIVFISLLLLTLFTWLIGQSEVINFIANNITANITGKLAFVILLTTAVIKVQLIGDFFMHLRSVSGFWRWIITLWVISTGGLITIAFL